MDDIDSFFTESDFLGSNAEALRGFQKELLKAISYNPLPADLVKQWKNSVRGFVESEGRIHFSICMGAWAVETSEGKIWIEQYREAYKNKSGGNS